MKGAHPFQLLLQNVLIKLWELLLPEQSKYVLGYSDIINDYCSILTIDRTLATSGLTSTLKTLSTSITTSLLSMLT